MKFQLESKYKPSGDQPRAIKQISEGFLKEEKTFQTLLGVTGSGKTFTMANIITRINKKTLILAPNKTLAAQLYAEFKAYFPKNRVEYFVSYYDYYRPEAYKSSTDTYIEKDSAVNDEIDKLRHSTTRSLLERDDVIVISSISCIYGLGSPQEYKQMQINLFIQTQIDREALLKDLISIQYSRNEVDFSRGTFRVRGEAIEIFPAYEDSEVIRLDFFDDELEEIHIIDPLTGNKIRSISKVSIYPASHYVVTKSRMHKAIKNIRQELKERIQYFEDESKLIEKQRIETRCTHDLDMMQEIGFCSGIENYSRHFTDHAPGDAPYTLLDFFEKKFLLIIDESHLAIPQINGMYKGDYSRKKSLVDFGFRLPCALDNRPLKFDEFWPRVDQVLFVSATPETFELEKSQGEFVEQLIRPTGLIDPPIEVRDSTHQVENLYLESKIIIEQGMRVLVTTLTKKLSEELSEYFTSKGIKSCYLHSDVSTLERMKILKDLRTGIYDVLIGINLLREGLDLPEVGLVGITDADQEGFLRSKTSLIQTIGRAARNSEGRVILYARKMTNAMNLAIEENNRRRIKQDEYNKIHGITPTTIISEIKLGIMEILTDTKKKSKMMKKNTKNNHLPLDVQLENNIKELKEKMKEHAKNLEFEKAAQLRDMIKELLIHGFVD